MTRVVFLLHALGGVVATPFRMLVIRRHVIATLTRRDLRGRYASSVLGLSWAVIQPLALLLLFTFVFSVVLRIRLGGSSSAYLFAAYVFCGMLPWIALQEGLTRSSSVILENVPLIKKVIFPSEILPVSVVFSALVLEMIGLSVFVLLLSLFHRVPTPALLVLPVIVGFQLMFTLGIGWVLASLTVFLRDVTQLLGLGMTFWMFITPIFYPPEMVPPAFAFLLLVNPMWYVVSAYRRVLLEGALPDLSQFAVFAGIAFVVFVAGGWFFRRSSPAFADVT